MNPVALYAVLARDVSDFFDMIREEQDINTLNDLYLMLTQFQPNLSHNEQQLNRVGRSLVMTEIQGRDLALPEVAALYKHSDYTVRGTTVDQLSLNEARDEVCRLMGVLQDLGVKLSASQGVINDWRQGKEH